MYHSQRLYTQNIHYCLVQNLQGLLASGSLEKIQTAIADIQKFQQ